MMTKDDQDFLEALGKASFPTNYAYLHDRFRTNHHYGRQAKDIMDKTTHQLRKYKETPNNLVVRTMSQNPKVWGQIMEDMSVVHCNDERTHTADDMKYVLGILLRELNEIPNDSKRDYHRIVIRNLTKYLINNKDGLTLDQCFGLDAVRSKERNPNVVPDFIVKAVDWLVFYNEENYSDEPYPDLVEVLQMIREEDGEAWCENQKPKLDYDDYFDSVRHLEDKDRFPKGVRTSKSKFDRNWKKYKHLALDVAIRDRLFKTKEHKLTLTDEQVRQIKKYWNLTEFPNEVKLAVENVMPK